MSKSFSLSVILTACTGRGIHAEGEKLTIADVANVIAHVVGHEVWTHELPTYAPRVRELICAQSELVRDIVKALDMSDSLNGSDYVTTARAVVTAKGVRLDWRVMLVNGNDERTESPVESAVRVRGRKNVVVVEG